MDVSKNNMTVPEENTTQPFKNTVEIFKAKVEKNRGDAVPTNTPRSDRKKGEPRRRSSDEDDLTKGPLKRKKGGSRKVSDKDEVPSETVCDIGKRTGQDACIMVKLVLIYMREILQLVCCVTEGGPAPNNTRFTETIEEFGQATLQLIKDFMMLFCSLLKPVYKYFMDVR